MKVGCFPLGPQPEAQRDMKFAADALERILGRLLAARRGTTLRFPAEMEPLERVLGKADCCLICGKSKHGEDDRIDDLDRWFCAAHCPVCNGVEAWRR